MIIRHVAARTLLALALALGPLGGTALAQSADLFRPVVRVNESIVTRYDLEQRLMLLELLRTPGITREGVLDELVGDRLKEEAGRRLGLLATTDQVALGMEEFAAQANLSAEEFIAAIAGAGVDAETFRAFVRAGITWRTITRQLFSAQAQVSETELDRAIALGTGQGSVSVLLSEIILPMTPESAGLSRQQADAIGEMTSFDDFEAAARQVSIAPSGANGGRLEWLPLSRLPPQVAPIFLTLAPGEVSPPVPLPGAEALALFQLRALRDGRPSLSRNVALDYAILRLAADESAPQMLADLRATLGNGRCASFFGQFPGAGVTRLERVEAERREISSGIAAAIDTLDPGEMAILPGGRAIAMLCDRTGVLGEDLSRDDLRQRLFARKLDDLAAGFLAELRANAYITRP